MPNNTKKYLKLTQIMKLAITGTNVCLQSKTILKDVIVYVWVQLWTPTNWNTHIIHVLEIAPLQTAEDRDILAAVLVSVRALKGKCILGYYI